MRKLASIEKIIEIKEHPNADRLEIAKIKGWEIVVLKNEFKAGMNVIYFEIDSFIPTEIAPFLTTREKPSIFKDRFGKIYFGERLTTKKIRGQISQGLILPISILPEGDYNVGDNLTEVLGIVKWERILQVPNDSIKAEFPSFVTKTNQERVQNLDFDSFANFDTEWVFEEKLDGSSCTVFYNRGQVGVCSRNFELKEDDINNSFVKYAYLETNLKAALSDLDKNIAVQGELCGPGIQGNKYKLNKPTFFVFDIFLIDSQRYATLLERIKLIEMLQFLGAKLQNVPIVAISKDKLSIDFCLEAAKGKSAFNSLQEREGLVIKSKKLLNGQVVSFKSISNNFLLKYKE